VLVLCADIHGERPCRRAERSAGLAICSALKRPAIFPVPPIALRLLFGEMAEVLLSSQRVSPKGAEEAGFRFRYPQLAAALADALA